MLWITARFIARFVAVIQIENCINIELQAMQLSIFTIIKGALKCNTQSYVKSMRNWKKILLV